MSRNALYATIAVLAVGAALLGYQLYQERHKTSGVEISVGNSGLKIEKK